MISKIIIIGWTLLIGYGFISGLANVLEGNPSDGVFAFALMFSVITHLGLWLLVALPTYMLSRMFARKSHAPISSS